MSADGDVSWALGVDVGGTYVDVVACASDGRLLARKQPRLAADGATQAVTEAVRRLCDAQRIAPGAVARIVHGSTVVTNLLLEQRAPPVAVFTNRGMCDVLALARQDRRELYRAVIAPPTPEARLFPQALRFEVAGRLDAAGHEVEPLGLDALPAAVQAMRQRGVQAAAVCLLFSHLDGSHERLLRDALLAALPGLKVSISSEVDPAPGEFERFLACALDAYARPAVEDYLAQLSASLDALGLPAVRVMRSEGLVGDWREAARRPLTLALSGPAAALEGVAVGLGDDRPAPPAVLTLDVGGTSTDIGMLDGDLRSVHGTGMELHGLRLRLRCADVDSLPIGGGSIVQVLPGQALRIGPQSQGARPGPAAHGLGGEHATLTDALCVLGRLPARLAGGFELDAAAAEHALLRNVGRPLGLAATEAAAAVVQAAAAAMAEALRMRSFQRGVDPADAVLVAAGGGGAQHAAEVAQLAGIRRVRVLPMAGVISALGLLNVPAAHDVQRACSGSLDEARLAALRATLPEPPPGGAPPARVRWQLSLALGGQASAIELDWEPTSEASDTLHARFLARYAELRGAAPPDAEVELRAVRGVFEQAAPAPRPHAGGGSTHAWAGVAPAGQGPCLLAAELTTVWVPAGWCWRRLPDDSLLLQPAQEALHD